MMSDTVNAVPSRARLCYVRDVETGCGYALAVLSMTKRTRLIKTSGNGFLEVDPPTSTRGINISSTNDRARRTYYGIFHFRRLRKVPPNRNQGDLGSTRSRGIGSISSSDS